MVSENLLSFWKSNFHVFSKSWGLPVILNTYGCLVELHQSLQNSYLNVEDKAPVSFHLSSDFLWLALPTVPFMICNRGARHYSPTALKHRRRVSLLERALTTVGEGPITHFWKLTLICASSNVASASLHLTWSGPFHQPWLPWLSRHRIHLYQTHSKMVVFK